MICNYNDSRCRHQGYCNCRRDDNTAEAAAGLGGLILWLLAGIVVSLVYPAAKILRSEAETDANGAPKFAGALWLFLSPLFGFLSNVLYQVVFAVGACSVDATRSRIAGAIYFIGMFTIYILAIGLALIAFLFRNRKTLKLFFTNAETRTGSKTLTVIGIGIMTLLVGFAGIGIVASASNGYFSHRAEVNAESERQGKIIFAAAANYDSYVGKYKLITREDDTVFQVRKSSDGKGLRLSRYEKKTNRATGETGCLLTPQSEGNSVYYAVSECVVDGEPSPLARVYFEIQKKRTVMDFVHNVRVNGDTLEKIK